MKVRFDRLGDEPYVWHEALAVATDELENPEVLAVGEVDCRGRITRTLPGFLLRMALSYEQTVSCTRCLGPVPSPIDSQLDLYVLVEEVEGATAAQAPEHRLAEQDLGLLVLTSPVLETRPLVVEQVQLNVPMKSLCRDECAGLCATCGADLNAGPCECRPQLDPRWAALAGWKKHHGDA
ncbi:MAG TPA: DUF177 domain-containing protein [Thermoanaerobaculia bacterium]|jgi:uncharacterized protein